MVAASFLSVNTRAGGLSSLHGVAQVSMAHARRAHVHTAWAAHLAKSAWHRFPAPNAYRGESDLIRLTPACLSDDVPDGTPQIFPMAAQLSAQIVSAAASNCTFLLFGQRSIMCMPFGYGVDALVRLESRIEAAKVFRASCVLAC